MSLEELISQAREVHSAHIKAVAVYEEKMAELLSDLCINTYAECETIEVLHAFIQKLPKGTHRSKLNFLFLLWVDRGNKPAYEEA
jgi:hypothetical protein